MYRVRKLLAGAPLSRQQTSNVCELLKQAFPMVFWLRAVKGGWIRERTFDIRWQTCSTLRFSLLISIELQSIGIISIYYDSIVFLPSSGVHSVPRYAVLSYLFNFRNGSNKLWELVYANDDQMYGEMMIFNRQGVRRWRWSSRNLLKVFISSQRVKKSDLDSFTMELPRRAGVQRCELLKVF